MSDFEAIDPNEPATVENVLMAVMRLRDYDEAMLAEVISQGRLHELFPFRPRSATLPPDTLDEAHVVEASPQSLTDSAYAELVKASTHSGGNAPSAYKRSQVSRTRQPRSGGGTKIRPLHDRVIIKRLEEERKTASGIVIPDTAAEKADQGEVTAVGKGKVDEEGKVRPLDVKVGDRVLFGKYSGQTVKIQGEELLVIREEDIMLVIAGSTTSK